MTFIAALRHDRIVAPLVLDGAINGRSFCAYVEQFLAPTLQPGDVVVADNLGSHKVAGARDAIEARGASLLFLPGLQPGHEPDRAGVQQAQAVPALRRTPHPPGTVAQDRPVPRSFQPNRMQQLPRQLWLSPVSVKPL